MNNFEVPMIRSEVEQNVSYEIDPVAGTITLTVDAELTEPIPDGAVFHQAYIACHNLLEGYENGRQNLLFSGDCYDPDTNRFHYTTTQKLRDLRQDYTTTSMLGLAIRYKIVQDDFTLLFLYPMNEYTFNSNPYDPIISEVISQ